MKIQAYIVKLSNGIDVQIDGDEVAKVMLGVSRGSIVRVRQGIINPSFFVGIVLDKKRVSAFLEETKYGDEKTKRLRREGLTKLDDIFAGVLMQIEERGTGYLGITHPRSQDLGGR